MNISCSKLLGVTSRFEFFGDYALNYRRVDAISFQGDLKTVDETGPVEDIWGQFLNTGDLDCSDVTINGYNFGSGRLVSLNYDTGTDARKKSYTVELEFDKTGNLFDYSANEFGSGIATGISLFREVNSFSEDFSFEREGDLYSYSRNLSFNIDGCDTGATVAKAIARLIFDNSPASPLILREYPDFYLSSGNRIFSEQYNVTKGSYSFSENFSLPSVGEEYFFDLEHSLDASINDYVTVTERGIITSSLSSDNTEAAFAAQSGSIFQRCLEVFSGWSGDIDDAYTGCLSPQYISRNISRNHCSKELSYSYEYSTDPRKNTCYSQDRDITINDNRGVVSVRERGNIKYLCGDQADRITMAKTIYSGETGNIHSRLSEAYDNFYSMFQCSETTEPNLISRNRTFANHEGSVEYEWEYSNDPTIVESGNIHRISNSLTDNEQTHLYNLFGIINTEEQAQASNTSNEGTLSNDITVQGKSGADLDDLIDAALILVQKPTGVYFMENWNYEYSPSDVSLKMGVDYKYFNRFKQIDDILLW